MLQGQHTCGFFQRMACLLIRRVLLPLYLKFKVKQTNLCFQPAAREDDKIEKERKKEEEVIFTKVFSFLNYFVPCAQQNRTRAERDTEKEGDPLL